MDRPDWKRLAVHNFKKKFPSYLRGIRLDNLDSPTGLFTDLADLFTHAYETDDKELSKALYEFAFWAVASKDQDLSSAAAVGFFEELGFYRKRAMEEPDSVYAAIVKDIPNHLSASDFDGFAALFAYWLSQEEVATMRRDLYGKQRESHGRV